MGLLVIAFLVGTIFFGVILLATFLKLAIRLILLPLFLVKWVVGGLLLLIVGPILSIAGLVLLFVFSALFFTPLLPLAIVAGLIWLIVQLVRRPALV